MIDSNLIGEDAAFLEVLDHVSEIAPLDKPVLVVGERGTGKELIATRLHNLSQRWDEVFLQLNCATLNDDILESELFGHEPGSFTGATGRHLGRFERADDGTLFLDELATSSTRVQEKILRIIEYGQFERLGDSQVREVDVRVIAATNQDLPGLAAQGRFREDLLDRLAFDVVTIPPLRERQDDIPLLADYFGLCMAQELEREMFNGFSAKAMDQLLNYDWPGNIRELKNVVERAVYRNVESEPIDDIVIDPFDSPFRLQLSGSEAHESTVSKKTWPIDFETTVEAFKNDLINTALERNKHNQRLAADDLQLTYHQFRYRLNNTG